MKGISDVSIITARMSSTRLPEKTIIKIKDHHSSIDITIERVKKIGIPVILATSDHPSDDILVDICKKHGIEIFRGSLQNKIKRIYDCFCQYKIKNALLVEGADICYDYDIAKRALYQLKTTNSDIIWCPDDIITGLFTLSMNFNAIKKLYQLVPSNNTDTDVFTHLFQRIDSEISYITLNDNEKNKDIRLTIDYEEDVIFFKKLYENFPITEKSSEITDYIIKNPELSKINFFREKDWKKNKISSIEKSNF
tara:strand:- start:1827 stop:2582 length:756 start_codon:yes stop_codon:yes gene_type:complete